jgi:hypothetical protein
VVQRGDVVGIETAREIREPERKTVARTRRPVERELLAAKPELVELRGESERRAARADIYRSMIRVSL